MAPITNGRYLFNEFPTGMFEWFKSESQRNVYKTQLPSLSGYPTPGITTVHDTSQTIDLAEVPLNGGFLIKVLVLSIDPLLRNRMDAPDPESSFNVGLLALFAPIMADVMPVI